MTRSHVDLLTELHDLLDREGVEAVIDHLTPDFEVSVPAELSAEPDTYRGADGIRRYFDSFYEVMDRVRLEPVEMVEVGDAVVVPFEVYTRGRSSGIETSLGAVAVWRFRDGLVARMELFTDRDAALEAARGAAG